MKRNEFFTMIIYAAATMVAALAIGLPSMLEAVPTVQQSAEIKQPKVSRDGCEMTVCWLDNGGKPAAPTCEAGQKPVFELTLTNATDQPVSTPWSVQMTSRAPASPVMRTLPMPRRIWSQDGNVTLKARETKTIRLETNTAVSAGALIAVTGQLGASASVQSPATPLVRWSVAMPANASPLMVTQK